MVKKGKTKASTMGRAKVARQIAAIERQLLSIRRRLEELQERTHKQMKKERSTD